MTARPLHTALVLVAMLWLFANSASAMLHPQQGRFLQRDQLGYVDGMGMYAYLLSAPPAFLDPEGTAAVPNGRPSTQRAIRLSFSTAVEPIDGFCGDYDSWQIEWVLSAAAPRGGVIIQHVDVTGRIFTCAGGTQREIPFDSTPFGFWEAWTVSPNENSPTNRSFFHDDAFWATPPREGKGLCTRGEITMKGTAEFYEGLVLPPDFKPDPKSPAGILPMTRRDPGRLPGGTGSILHQMTIKWDCSKGVQLTEITHN